ncbi:NADPH-dependent F420 reductase [Undibacterium arcticum]
MAIRWAAAGFPVVLGSRSSDKAKEAALQIKAGNGAPAVRGEDNVTAAGVADIVIVAVPFSHHDATLDEIKSVVSGKIIVDAVVPLVPPKVSQVQLPPKGSAGQIAHERLGDVARVVSAFHNVGAAKIAEWRRDRMRCAGMRQRQRGA